MSKAPSLPTSARGVALTLEPLERSRRASQSHAYLVPNAKIVTNQGVAFFSACSCKNFRQLFLDSISRSDFADLAQADISFLLLSRFPGVARDQGTWPAIPNL